MQTTTATKAGNAPDLLQGILSVQVRNEGEAALFAYVVPFLVSSVGGALIAVLILAALSKTGVLKTLLPAQGGKQG